MTACGRTVTTDNKTGMVLVKGARVALCWEVSPTGSGDRLSWQRGGYSGSLEFWSGVERLMVCISCSEAPHGCRMRELCSVSWPC